MAAHRRPLTLEDHARRSGRLDDIGRLSRTEMSAFVGRHQKADLAALRDAPVQLRADALAAWFYSNEQPVSSGCHRDVARQMSSGLLALEMGLKRSGRGAAEHLERLEGLGSGSILCSRAYEVVLGALPVAHKSMSRAETQGLLGAVFEGARIEKQIEAMSTSVSRQCRTNSKFDLRSSLIRQAEEMAHGIARNPVSARRTLPTLIGARKIIELPGSPAADVARAAQEMALMTRRFPETTRRVAFAAGFATLACEARDRDLETKAQHSSRRDKTEERA